MILLETPAWLDLELSEESADCLRGVTPWTRMGQFFFFGRGEVLAGAHCVHIQVWNMPPWAGMVMDGAMLTFVEGE